MRCPLGAHLPQPLFSTVHFILTNLDTFHLVNVAMADALSMRNIVMRCDQDSSQPCTLYLFKAPETISSTPLLFKTQSCFIYPHVPSHPHVDSIYAIFSICAYESDLPVTVSLLPAGSRNGKRSATEGAPLLPKKGRDCSD